MRDRRSRAYGLKTPSLGKVVRPERIELEPSCGRERSGSPQAKSRAERGIWGNSKVSKENMVRPERIELPTSWFVAKHSIQLSYGRLVEKLGL